jgi:hypothetical protein
VRHAQAVERANELERLASHLSGVASVTARVELPDPLAAPLDGPPETPSVQLRVAAPIQHWGNLREQLPPLSGAVFPDFPGTVLSIHLQRPASTSAPQWISVGPFLVAPDSAGPLRATLGALLASSALLALLLVRYARARLRRSIEDKTGT